MPYNLAAEKFGTKNANPDSLVSDKAPYLKYTWIASFAFDDEGSGNAEEQQPGLDASGRANAAEDPRVIRDAMTGSTAVSINDIVLKTFELPRWSTDTQIVNSYNHKVIVQTKLNYEPITISFYDQQNQAAETLIWDFVKGQFDSNDASKKAGIRPLKITVKMHTNSAGSIENSPNKTYTLGKAYIIDAQHDTLDYSTSDVVLWTITIRYETLDVAGIYEGEPPKVSVGIAKKEPQKTLPPQSPPPTEPIPDASPSLMELEGFTDPYGTTDGAAIMGSVNYNPTGLSTVKDQQRSREKAQRAQQPPGGDSQAAYTGYESAFVPTPPGPGARGFNASTGTTAQQTNNTPGTSSRRVDDPTARESSSAKQDQPRMRRTVVTASEDPGGVAGAQARNDARRQIQDHNDAMQARRTGQTVEQVREARARNIRELDRKTGNDF